MSYEFGSNSLEIKNPFKPEGVLWVITGIAIGILGVLQLFSMMQDLDNNAIIIAWEKGLLGLALLGWGLRHAGQGLSRLFRYFVGRSVPTSLAKNRDPNEQENAEREDRKLAYTAEQLTSMLSGRKNSTFIEPESWLSRLVHTLLQPLIFMPYPIRNYAQTLAALLITTLIAILTYGIAWFIATSGLIGDAGKFLLPVFSILLLLYLVSTWKHAANDLSMAKNTFLHNTQAAPLSTLIGMAIIVPAIFGYLYTKLPESVTAQLLTWQDSLLTFRAGYNLTQLSIIITLVLLFSWLMIRARFKLAKPDTQVSEFRENMQESVHPDEIFIHIENIILANRRYREMPNRVYTSFEPVLNEQSDGKGNFRGELLIETQPEYQPLAYSTAFKFTRLLTTIIGQGLTFLAALMLIALATTLVEMALLVKDNLPQFKQLSQLASSQQVTLLTTAGTHIAAILTAWFSWHITLSGARLLASGSHLFWAEMQFNSLLMWMKTDGTYTESRISTGMAIHDSTRSENTLVRSSITPWIITSRITSSTYATSGLQNLEMPRYILRMNNNEPELATIVAEIRHFLRNRETIASITNETDLGNAETIFRLNTASRKHMHDITQQQLSDDQQAAAKRLSDQGNPDEQ